MAASSWSRPTKRVRPRAAPPASAAALHWHRPARTPPPAPEPFDGDRPQGVDLHQPLHQAQGGRREADAARRGQLFHARCQVRGFPHGRVVHVQVVANGAHHHFAGVQADAHTQFQATGAADVVGVGAHGGLHRQGGIAGAQGVVLVGNGGTEQGHNAIAEHLVHRALEAVHGVHHAVQRRVEELLGGFGVEAANQLGGVFEIGKQHRHLLALACQGTAGGENLLGQMPGGIDLGSGKGPCGLYRGGSGAQTLSALGAEFCLWRCCKATGWADHLQPLAALLAEPGRGTIVMLAMRTLHLQGPLDLYSGAA